MTPRTAASESPEAARFFLALGDATRLALLAELCDGERTVSALVAALRCPQPKVSRHLKVLRDAGLVRDRKDGRNVHYVLTTTASWSKDAREWVERLDAGLQPGELMPAKPSAGKPRAARKPAARRPAREPAAESARRGSDLEDYLL